MTPAQLAKLHAACFPAPWSESSFATQLLQPGTFALGDERGFILCRTVLDECEILTFAVDPTHQRKGLATQLLSDAIAQTPAKTIFLEVAENNESALNLYKKAGFREISRRKRYYGGTTDALTMRIDIKK